MKRLSENQWKVLRGISSTGRVFDGRQIRTLDSLARLGLISYSSRWRCCSCGTYGCPVHKTGRWQALAELTAAGSALLGSAT